MANIDITIGRYSHFFRNHNWPLHCTLKLPHISTIQLVPPSFRVLSLLITHNVDLKIPVARLVHKCRFGHSYSQLSDIGFPCVKVETYKLGHGLTLSYTETLQEVYRGLVWISELSCHPLCVFLGRECQVNLSSYEWLEKIEKKHNEWLDKLPNV